MKRKFEQLKLQLQTAQFEYGQYRAGLRKRKQPTGKRRVLVAIYKRVSIPNGVTEAGNYTWSIVVAPKNASGPVCDEYDVFNDPYAPDPSWSFRVQSHTDPEAQATLVVRIMIGKITPAITGQSIGYELSQVPLPALGASPEQSSATWIIDAIRRLQQYRGAAEDFDVNWFVGKHALERITESLRQQTTSNVFNVTQRVY